MIHCADCGKKFSSKEHKHLIEDNLMCDDCYKGYVSFINKPTEKDKEISNSEEISKQQRIEELKRKKKELEFETSKVKAKHFKKKMPIPLRIIGIIIGIILIFSGINSLIETEESAPYKVYSLNEEIPVDYLNYKITKAESFNEMGSSIFIKETEGKFVKVYIEILNNAKETKDIFSPRFKIEDNQGRRFDEVSDYMLYIADYISFGTQLQPGLKVSGAIVFELPSDAEGLKLVLSGDWLSETEVIANIGEVKDIGQDTTQKEKTEEIMGGAIEESEEMMEELMNKCSAPFQCSSNCPEYMDVGKKDCDSGELCCVQ